MVKGVIPAIITPFTKNNEIDEEGLRENIQFLIDRGVNGIVPCGTTGESATLSFAEHKRVIDIAVDASSVPVIAGTGSNNTKEAIELTKYAETAGADGALLITPYYNKPNDSGLIKHFERIAGEVNFPIVLYNVPSRTGINLKPDVVATLAKIENITGIKEASGNLEQISRIIELTKNEDFFILSGDDALTLPVMALGGTGVISVAANVAPDLVVNMVDAFNRGDLEEARRAHFKLAPLIRALFLETNPIPVKKACELIGLAAGELRMPLAPLSRENEEVLKKAIENLDIKK